MGKMILNGTEYSGGAEVTFVNGLFIDTNNVIVPETRYIGSVTYTATADCAVTYTIANSANSGADVTLDGEPISVIFGVQINLLGDTIFVKKGQTLVIRTSFSSADVMYKVYGVQPASNVTFIPDYASACYSTQEREVGCWVDGKPLYQITVDQTIGSDADYTVFANGIENAHLVSAKCEYSSGRWMSANYPSIGTLSSSRFCYVEAWNGALKLHNQANQSMRWVATIQYTKTADVAGSGTWTPLGKPTVHYSTEEQVIGTWIDGKPIYEITVDKSSNPVTIDTNWAIIVNIPSIKRIIRSTVLCGNKMEVKAVEVNIDNSDNVLVERVGVNSGDTRQLTELMIQYTKTTD